MRSSHLYLKKSLIAAMILVMAAVGCIPEASAANKVVGKINIILADQGEIKPVDGTNYLLIQSKENKLWGVYNTDGERLMDAIMENPEYVAYTCFSDQKTEVQTKKSKNNQKNNKQDNYNGLYQVTYVNGEPVQTDQFNQKALVAIQGNFISGYEYGFIRAYNQHWAVGWVVSEASEESYDYSPNKKQFYSIERCDVFALTNGGRLVAQLNRDQFETAAAHGEYISIADREGNVSVYDADFNLTKLKTGKVTDAIYNIVDFAVADRVKNKMILDGFTACREITTTDGVLLQVTRTYLDGSKQSGIINLAGEWLLPLTSDTIKTVTAKYAIMADAENRLGLYSYSEQRLLIPYMYEKYLTNNKQSNPYIYYGYAIATDGDNRYDINLETGEVEQNILYNRRKHVTIGGTIYFRESRIRFLFTAANGTEWRMKDYRVESVRGDGRLIVARIIRTGSYGIFNMNGDIALEFKNKYKPLITDDGKVVLHTNKNGYQLVEIDW